MKFRRTLLKGLAILAVMPAALAFAQQTPLNDVLSGTDIPLTMRPYGIPAEYKAVKITQAGTGDALGLSSMMPTMMAIGAVNNMGAPAQMFLEILPISWTKGETVQIMGQEFLVTYGIDMGPETLRGMSNSKKLPAFNLRLKLIKTSDVGSITPLPEWNRDKYERAMTQVAMIPTSSRVAINTKPAPVVAVPTHEITGAPAPIKPSNEVAVEINPSNNTAVKAASVARPVDANLYETAGENAKSVATAMMLYAQDYDDTFPYVQSTKGAEYVIYPYVKNSAMYETLNPVMPTHFRFNICLAGVKMDEIGNPAATVLYYDPYAWPNGTYLVAFADTHSKFLTAEEWETVKQTLVLKLPRHGQPLPANLGIAPAGTSPKAATGK